jgi:hypothetical protein
MKAIFFILIPIRGTDAMPTFFVQSGFFLKNGRCLDEYADERRFDGRDHYSH